jgi:hypothetical protein
MYAKGFKRRFIQKNRVNYEVEKDHFSSIEENNSTMNTEVTG